MSCTNVILGIDCGTLNSRACAFIGEQCIEKIYTRSRKSTIPSFVSFSNEIFVGEKAQKSNSKTIISGHMQILGRRSDEEAVQRLLNTNNSNVVDVGGLPKYNVTYRGEPLSLRPEMIAGIVLDQVRSEAEHHVSRKITDVVITVPLHFNQSQRQATIDSAKIAGLNVIRIVNEPTAAAIAYFYDNTERNMNKKIILIYHLGASTFDLSIVEFVGDSITVLYAKGGYNLGGMYINSLIYDWVIAKMEEKQGFDVNTINNNYKSINKNIEEAKIELSASIEANITVFNCHFDEKISSSCFNKLIKEKVIDETFKIIDDSLRKCKINKQNVDEVLLLGGSCKIEAIKNRMEEEFNKVHPATFMEHIASRGAAILGAKLERKLTKQFNVTEAVHTRLVFSGRKVHSEIVKIPFGVNEEPEEKILEILVDNDVYPKICMRYHIDGNGILKLGVMEDQMEMDDKMIRALQRKKESMSEQNVSTQAIKEALNDLRMIVHKHVNIQYDSNIMDKYKEIFVNICKDISENRMDTSQYNSLVKILMKKRSIERYISFILEVGRTNF